LILLFVHVLLHPLVHTVGVSAAANQAVISGPAAPADAALNGGDQCELCRVGHNSVATPQLPQSELLNPRWVVTALHAVNYASLQADHRLPSRAPPSL